jgi:hypothetical protein
MKTLRKNKFEYAFGSTIGVSFGSVGLDGFFSVNKNEKYLNMKQVWTMAESKRDIIVAYLGLHSDYMKVINRRMKCVIHKIRNNFVDTSRTI